MNVPLPVPEDIWNDPRFISLAGHASKLTYLYLLTSHQRHRCGVFRLDLRHMAVDLSGPGALDQVIDAGLIEWEPPYVRLVGYCSQMPLLGPNVVIGLCRYIREVPYSAIVARATVELIHACLEKSARSGWNLKRKDGKAMLRTITDLMEVIVSPPRRDLTMNAIAALGLEPADPVWADCWLYVAERYNLELPPVRFETKEQIAAFRLVAKSLREQMQITTIIGAR
jgi:hypothetical protein